MTRIEDVLAESQARLARTAKRMADGTLGGRSLSASPPGRPVGLHVVADRGAPSGTVIPETGWGQAASAGSFASLWAAGDHTHGTPPDPIPPHVGATDPHTQYVTSVTATSPIASSGGRAPAISATTGQTAGTLAVGDDNRFPTVDQRAAMVPAQGTAPTAANPFVVGDDPRMTNSRSPTAHASTHNAGGSDAVTFPVSSVNGRTGAVVGLAEDNQVIKTSGDQSRSNTLSIPAPAKIRFVAPNGTNSMSLMGHNPVTGGIGYGVTFWDENRNRTIAATCSSSAFFDIGPKLHQTASPASGKRIALGVLNDGAVADNHEITFWWTEGGSSPGGLLTTETSTDRTVRIASGRPASQAHTGCRLFLRSETGLFIEKPGIAARSALLHLSDNVIDTTTAQMMVQAGNTVVTTSTVGTATITYPVAFPGGTLQVICTNGDWNTQPGATLSVGDYGTTSFGVRVRVNNADLASTAFRVHWVAFGY